MSIRYFIMKSEPSEFSIQDLERKGEAFWDGVRNYQVRNLMRDRMRVGDRAFFYHSSCADVGIAGEMEIVSQAMPDPAQFDTASKYYDPKSTPEVPRWLGVKVAQVATYPSIVPLAALKSDPHLCSLRILERGNRLSITEITSDEYRRIKTLAA